MINTKKTLTATLMGLSFTAIATTSEPTSQYGMSLHDELVTTANGAVTTFPQANVNKNWEVETKQVTEITDDVYRIAGWGIGNIIAVKGSEGWVIIDTGDNKKYAKEQRLALEEKVGQPINVAAVLYTHTHYAHGTEAWLDEATKIYGHEHLVANLQADSGVSVLSGNFNTRAAIQFGMLHPTHGEDAFPSLLGFSAEKLTGTSGFVAPTVTFADGVVETHSIAGITVEVLPSPTDVLDSVAFYFPETKLLVSNAMNNGSMFNLYTLRGDVYRDPIRLVKAADLALSRDIKYHVDIHGAANIGEKNAREALESFRDSMQLIHDQTYRGIAMGKDAQEIAEWIYMPEEQRVGKETYGQVESYAKQVYSARIGWMGWDVYEINPLPKQTQASRTVEAMGGGEAVLSMIDKERPIDNVQSAQWVLHLTSQLTNMNDLPDAAKQARIEAARMLGQHTTSANARGFYVSEALLLEGKLSLGEFTINDYQELSRVLGAMTAEKLYQSPVNDNVQYLRYLVDSRKAEGKFVEFNVKFTEYNELYSIVLRNGVIAITHQPNSGKTFELDKREWNQLVLGEKRFSELDDELAIIEQVIVR
ncbi:alkyl sulfatase dimerization domain-containing protein [Shewanella atlantica]|uniref:MBL fold metallo-hydrolase n=1 Tax=Shewanella atlantica TaxID=271099 RepID=A0A431WCN6_9GAMM|nr:alkyl sulfatase dimerization domain-containing protein [Shewanella atlantica]RTR33284.1 MBL fold metallo-hydrolase [Shewanella atlantica]